MAVIVHGLRDLNRAFADVGKHTTKELRDTLKEAAEPVREEAERLAVSSIPRIGVRWSRMRVGVTTKVVYLAPRQRSRGRGDDPRRRPNLAGLLLTRSMEPALRQNEGRVEERVDDMLERVCDDFNRGGHVGS